MEKYITYCLTNIYFYPGNWLCSCANVKLFFFHKIECKTES